MKRVLFILFWCISALAAAQDVVLPGNKLGSLTDRLMQVAQVLPQEKVYIHMDNTSYFLGDSIWFAAYLRRTSDDRLSNISGVLYVELLNQDGYLMERQMIDTRDGMGSGVFHLNPDWYAGYYELRAYTRWQLNWGVHERKHSSEAKYWFINREMEHRYFRDYDKLYSRVFPVYNAPRQPGQYNELMTLRELARTYGDKYDKPQLQLQLYPEGGALIGGVPCRVAFEASYSDGRACEGYVTMNGEEVAKTQSRGRGVFEVKDSKGRQEVEFVCSNGQKVSARLPKAEADGVALRVERRDSTWHFSIRKAGTVQRDTLGVTVMHEGRVAHFSELTDTLTTFSLSNSDLECGVNQVTVFDGDGRVYSDRLFFVSRPELFEPSLTVSGLKDSYEPYEKITLSVQAPLNPPLRGEDSLTSPSPKGEGRGGASPSAIISLSVRDSETSNNLFDNASIMAEMLLSSEIRGFVPSPDWYFESDDRLHRTALDLLMMTQGWRRFDWRSLAVRGAWEPSQPSERTPVIVGYLYKYYPGHFYHPKDAHLYGEGGEYYEWLANMEDKDIEPNIPMERETLEDIRERERDVKHKIRGSALVHAELVPIGEKDGAVAETPTKNGKFVITLPRFYDPAVFFLSASDTAKWKRRINIFSKRKRYKRYEWIQKMPDEWDYHKVRAKDGEFSIRVDWPYPRFVKPYNYYQQNINYQEETHLGERILDDGTRQMDEVKIRAHRPSYHLVHDSLPAFIVDGYEAYNFSLDAGMLSSGATEIARAYVGDYGLELPYTHRVEEGGVTVQDDRLRALRGSDDIHRAFKGLTLNDDSTGLRRSLSVEKIGIFHPERVKEPVTRYVWEQNYLNLRRIEQYAVYTEFQPRLIGSQRYAGSNLPYTYIAICPYPLNSERTMYRDRRYILPGLSWPEKFYSPDYSQRELPAEPTDHRRTLYWNPTLPLDADGHATVELWNNSRPTQITVTANGVTSNGEVLTTR